MYFSLPESELPASTAVWYLPGKTTSGHHQIQSNCSVCHSADGSVQDDSCLSCHSQELKRFRDTHPKSKFIDPTKAALLEKIDATRCVTCHTEHREELTLQMGVTVPIDYCIHCHEDVANDRPSHKQFEFDTCTNTGCHNYHDNTALYENFLSKHLSEEDHRPDGQTAIRKYQQWLIENEAAIAAKKMPPVADGPVENHSTQAIQDWRTSAHAMMEVNCTACHIADQIESDETPVVEDRWVEMPDHNSCVKCHKFEVEGFLQGKHGMALYSGLPAMTPETARLPMHRSPSHHELNCSACHSAHNPNPDFAAIDACLNCHADDHSTAYKSTSHFELARAERSGNGLPGSGVTCATCHMPREIDGRVQHNQTLTLRPIEKMARSVCMQCHGLQFTLDALADPNLSSTCYSSAPSARVSSLDMVQDWFNQKGDK